MPELVLDVNDKVYNVLQSYSDPERAAAKLLTQLMLKGKRRKDSIPVFVPAWFSKMGTMSDRELAKIVFDLKDPPKSKVTDISTTRDTLGWRAWRPQKKKRVLDDDERMRIWGSMKGVGFTKSAVVRALALRSIEKALLWAEAQDAQDLVEYLRKG